MNNHNHSPLEDLSVYLDVIPYIDDDGEVKFAYLQEETPWLPINDPGKICPEEDVS